MSWPNVPVDGGQRDSHRKLAQAINHLLGNVTTGGASAWGDITGTLSAQTDLQTALNGKQPLATVLTNTTASFTTAQETKLSGIATAATANSADAALLSRANHTGDQLAATISDFSTAVAATASVTANTAKETNATHTGDVTGATALTIANDAVTYAKMQNASAASVLIGRGSAGGAGDVQEVTLGANLTMTGTVLSASGGGSAIWQTNERRISMSASVIAGTYTGNPNNSLGGLPVSSFYWSSGNTVAKLRFDFEASFAQPITGVGIGQNSTTTQGTWDIEGSNDAVSWTALKSGITWNPVAVNGLTIDLEEFTNTTTYRYIQLTQTGGTTSSSPYVNWFIFKHP